VDKKRADDHVAVTEEVRNAIAGLEKTLGGSGPAPTRAAPQRPVNNSAPPANVENGFVYTVQSGDSLGAIVHAYNADFKSKGLKAITLKQTREANPNVNWDKLRVGQKIVVPRPAE
jgi:Tfp pilus assembly protein FimV